MLQVKISVITTVVQFFLSDFDTMYMNSVIEKEPEGPVCPFKWLLQHKAYVSVIQWFERGVFFVV